MQKREEDMIPMTLASWEKGRTEPRVGQLSQLAELLGVSVTDLIEGT
jgi:hypothetical protein